MTCSHDDSSWCTDECTRPVTATEITQRNELFFRNQSNRERWTFLYVWMNACSMLGQFPDIRDQATIDRYDSMMKRRIRAVHLTGTGVVLFARPEIATDRENVILKEEYQRKLDAGECT